MAFCIFCLFVCFGGLLFGKSVQGLKVAADAQHSALAHAVTAVHGENPLRVVIFGFLAFFGAGGAFVGFVGFLIKHVSLCFRFG